MKHLTKEPVQTYFDQLLTETTPIFKDEKLDYLPNFSEFERLQELEALLTQTEAITQVNLDVQVQNLPTCEPIIKQNQEIQAFKGLYFLVEGLPFVVPLPMLFGVCYAQKITPLFGCASWMKGVMFYQKKLIHVIDLSLLLKLKQRRTIIDNPWVIFLKDAPVGMACESVQGIEMVEVAQIDFNSQHAQPNWLFGYTQHDLSSILNIQEVLQLIY